MALRGTLFRGDCSCKPAARSRGNFASERIACMRDVIYRERITCPTRRFIRGKTKNKHRVGDSRRKKKDGSREIFDPSKSARETSRGPLPLSPLSPPIRLQAVRSNFYKRVECPRGIYYPSWKLLPAVARITLRTALHRYSEFINRELSNRSLPRLQYYIT